MSLSNGEMSAADIAAVVGNNGNGLSSLMGDGGIWIIVLFLFALMGGWNGNGGCNNGNAGQTVYPVVQQGFDQAAVMGGLNTLASATAAGFANAETAASARQIADMQMGYQAQISSLQSMNNLSSQFANCCCENRLATANLASDIAREACADRSAVSSALQDVIAANNASTQRILDQMCQDKIDAKNEQIANLRQQLNMAQLSASQNAQTASILANNEAQTAALEQYLSPTPRPAYVVPAPWSSQYTACGCSMT